MGVSIEVKFEQIEAGRHQLPCLVATIPSEVLSTRSDSSRAFDEHVAGQVVEPQVPRPRFEDVDHISTNGERVVYAVGSKTTLSRRSRVTGRPTILVPQQGEYTPPNFARTRSAHIARRPSRAYYSRTLVPNPRREVP